MKSKKKKEEVNTLFFILFSILMFLLQRFFINTFFLSVSFIQSSLKISLIQRILVFTLLRNDRSCVFNSLLTKGRENTYKQIKTRTTWCSFLLLVLSVSDDVAQVLVVQVSSNVQREVCEHLIYLKVSEPEERNNQLNVLLTPIK